MKKPFDRIIGPDGKWRDPDAGGSKFYLVLGVIHPANFENPAVILKIVLTYLGLPTQLPVRLSFSDQARFAAETIRRIAANGRFNNVVVS